MKHSGKAASAALKLIGWTLAGLVLLLGLALLGKIVGAFIWSIWAVFVVLWMLFAGFTFYFFRDPEAMVPTGKNLVVSPGHGKVDVVDTTQEMEFMGGECRRISMFLSVIDIHVQNAPITGRVAFLRHKPGQYLNAMRTECATCNENVLIGIESAEPAGEKIGVRLIAGMIARRIIPWISENEIIQRGERISLIQFGSRVDVYLPMRAQIKIKTGDRVVGGETVLAVFD